MGAAISYCSPQQVLTAAICEDGKGPDYNHLPCPVKYEEITREAYSKSPCHQCPNWISFIPKCLVNVQHCPHHCLLNRGCVYVTRVLIICSSKSKWNTRTWCIRSIVTSLIDIGTGFYFSRNSCNLFDNWVSAISVSLKPEHFEGLRFDVTKSLNSKFALSNR